MNNVHIKICNLSCDYLLFFRIIFRLWIVFLTLNTTTMETTVKRAGSRHDTNIFLIWEHQRYFQTAFQSMAKNMFDLIDHEVSPHVFLLGVKMNDVADKPLQVYLEPKDCGYSADIFSGLKKLVHELESMEKTTDKVSKSIGASDIQSNVNNYSYIRAIETILSNEGLQNDKQKFVSYPAFINDFAVFIILEVQEGALYEQYSLKREIYKSNPSFVKSCIWIYLRTCLGFLKNPSNTSDILDKYPEEIMREAGKLFMYTISQCGNNRYSPYGFYEACNIISSLRYEGREGLGKLVIAEKNHPNIILSLQLEYPINMNDFRKVRKFLEMSDDKSLIISDATFIYGLGYIKGKYDPQDESLFIINFVKHFHWEVLHDANTMMIVEYKLPALPKVRINKEKFYIDFRKIFADIKKEQLDQLWDITSEATKQKQGTILVITDNAIEEAKRLGKQCFPVKPIKLRAEIMQQITSIDGSVLLDRNAVCYAIGAILDGIATDKGDASRGARYNSAVRYYEYFGKKCATILVIISEDGIINLIPNLKHQVTLPAMAYEINK